MSRETQMLLDAAALQGDLRDMLIAGLIVMLALVIPCLLIDLRRRR